MNILLVSQCSKRALTESRRILDQFAERRGERTWQTSITQAGLKTLHKLLRSTARKNTAVACHWIRGMDRSELLWIVGDARQFNIRGATPTNTTARDVLRSGDEDDWRSAEDIRLLAALAGLFHDFGKAVLSFQEKLQNNRMIADPYRHEWVSLRLFEAFVHKDDDQNWLRRLEAVSSADTRDCCDRLRRDGIDTVRGPFKSLPPLAKAVGWLIVSHHRIPAASDGRLNTNQLRGLPDEICSGWCGPRTDATDVERKKCWNLKQGLPFDSEHWCRHASKLATAMLQRQGMLTTEWYNDMFVMHTARMALMLADHYYSGQPSHARYGDAGFPLYANTDRETRQLKQRLDEHLIGVEVNASRIVRSLPGLAEALPRIARHKGFRRRSADRRFAWQDKAFDLAEGLRSRTLEQGFFGVNMASTGCGKTLANGRIMYALANPQLGARFAIALGLRTLTLQTGDAYRERLALGDEDLAVMVGGAAIRELHALNAHPGSESSASLLPEWQHVHFEGSLEDGPLNRWLSDSPQAKRLLNAPVLTCTIDHLMPATEGTRGGRQILPMLRLMSSDLVLDEPDDFGLEDLPALARLVNWAGMLGSRVLLSSATLPPALVQGLFDAYMAGRQQYQRNRGRPGQPVSVCCAWFDEFSAIGHECSNSEDYLAAHDSFVTKRLRKLETRSRSDNRRKAVISPLDIAPGLPELECFQAFASHVYSGIPELHQAHHQTDAVTGKNISVGLVRMANISPLIEVAKLLFETDAPENTRIHLCVYHSQHPLLIRSAIEQKLDELLARHDEQAWFSSGEVRRLLDNHTEQHQIVVVLATPVAEVGRDHDYDWAIVEPSSMRSVIQLAGRIRRHRSGTVERANLYLLDTNLKHLRSGLKEPAFHRPGFESQQFKLNSHYLADLLTEEQLKRIDASSRIQVRPGADPAGNLVDLEHDVIRQRIQGTPPGEPVKIHPASLWWRFRSSPLSALLQRAQPFRYDPKGRQRYVLMPEDDGDHFMLMDDEGQLRGAENLRTSIECDVGMNVSPWVGTDYLEALELLASKLSMDISLVARRYGYVDLPAKGCENGWYYCSQFGFSRKD